MKDVIPTLEQLIASFEANGLEKYATELQVVKEAFQWTQHVPIKRRPQMPLYKPLDRPQAISPTSKIPFAQPGEEILEIGPEGDKEKRYQWPDRGQALSVPQLVQYFQEGMFDVDFLKDQAQKAKTPRDKAYIEGLLQQARKQERVKTAAEKLLEISEKSRQSGRDDVADTLEAAAADIIKSGTPERHTVASLEQAYQKSKTSEDWAKNLKKALDVYEGSAGVIKLFINAYKQKSRQLAQGAQTDTESDELGDLVRDADRKISSKFAELDNELSQ